MATKACPHCKKADLDRYAEFCKYCGKDILEFYDKPIGYGLLGVISGVIGFFSWPFFIVAGLFLLLQVMQNSK